MLRKFILITTLTFGGVQARADGLDLNDALFGCIMSGGECLTHTGIPVIDTFFNVLTGTGNYAARYTKKDMCADYICNWHSHSNSGIPGHDACRSITQAFYKQKAIKEGHWTPQAESDEDYLAMLEKVWLKRKDGEPYFDCTPSQRRIFIKSRCFEDKYSIYIGPDGNIPYKYSLACGRGGRLRSHTF